ncbi:hypothetical protein GCM10009623_19330 [Nocardioides aestuarii]|uniref:DUF4175 domain-containing protein n=1 Tax=Nocardioides aestuarii TaxID=252231 RepID=A0ABW4TKI0_9ACTN
MNASPEAKHAPVGALRAGLLLLVVGALLAWWSPGEVPGWVWVTTIFVGGVLVATALGIRMLRA